MDFIKDYYIYCIIEKKLNQIIYIGITTNFNLRVNTHKYRVNFKNYPVYIYIKSIGLEEFEFKCVCSLKCSKNDILILERNLVENLNPKYNSYLQYKDIKKLRKDYYENNKEYISNINKEYRNINKEILTKTYIWECGGKYQKTHKSGHIKTKRHINFFNK